MSSMLYAFVRRDFLMMVSYRLAFVYQIGSVLLVTAVLYVIGQTVGFQHGETVAGISRDYFDFLMAGFAFTDVLTLGLSAFPKAIRDGQVTGTLETMLLTHSRLFPLIVYSSVYSFFLNFFRLIIYIILAVFVFGLWSSVNLLSVILIFVLSIATFSSIGVMFAAFVLLFKQADAVVGLYGMASGLLGGVLFPLTVLPQWAHPIANLLPLSHALQGLRLGLAGTDPSGLWTQLGSLALMAAVLMPCSVMLFYRALNHAKMDGSLVQY
jgi:ABC-2 type transport system permease protein